MFHQVPIDEAVLAEVERHSTELSGNLEVALLKLSTAVFQVRHLG
jgi:hypothetical protein